MSAGDVVGTIIGTMIGAAFLGTIAALTIAIFGKRSDEER